MDPAALHRRRLDEGRALHQIGELAAGFRHVGTGAEADPAAAGNEAVPIAAGDDHDIGIVGDDPLGVDRAESAGDQRRRQVTAARERDHLAEILVTEGHAAIVGIAAGALDHDERALEIARLGEPVGDQRDLLGAVFDEVLGDLLLAEELADQPHRRLGVFERLLAEVDIDHGDPDRGQFLDQPGLVAGDLGLDVHEQHVGLQRDRLLDVEGAFLHAAEGRQLGDLRIAREIGLVVFGIGLAEIVAPADDALERLVLVERGDEIHLPALAEDDLAHRRLDLDLAADDVGHDDLFGGGRQGGDQKNAGSGESAQDSPFRQHRGSLV